MLANLDDYGGEEFAPTMSKKIVRLSANPRVNDMDTLFYLIIICMGTQSQSLQRLWYSLVHMLITVVLVDDCVDDARQTFVTPWSAFTIPSRTPFYFMYVVRKCNKINGCLFRTIMTTNRPLHRANQVISECPEMRIHRPCSNAIFAG